MTRNPASRNGICSRSASAGVRTEEYPHVVPFIHRSGERIEPLISLQWFMRMDELAQPAIEAVKDGRVRIHPERWTRVYLMGVPFSMTVTSSVVASPTTGSPTSIASIKAKPRLVNRSG